MALGFLDTYINNAFSLAFAGNEQLRQQGLIYRKVDRNSYVLENLAPYYLVLFSCLILFIASVFKKKIFVGVLSAVAVIACLYVLQGRWRRFNNTFPYGSRTGVRSQYPHGLKVGDIVELVQDDPPPNAAYTCNTSGRVLDPLLNGAIDVILIIDSYNFVIRKTSPSQLVINTGWWRKL